MRRMVLGLGVLLGILSSALAPRSTSAQWLYPPRAPLDPGYGFIGSGYYYAWNDPLIYDWRLWREYTGLSGFNFGGGYVASGYVGRPVIYGGGVSQPVQVGIDFVPLEYAMPDYNTGAPPLDGPLVVSGAPKGELASLLSTLSPSDREVLARHLRKTSGKETADDVKVAAAKVRRTSVAAKMRASDSIDAGDALFREQKHHEALQRYKAATTTAPDMVETWLRQGFALAATGRYELAARVFRRAAAIDERALEARFTLDDLYRDAVEAKSSHYDSLARAAFAEPERADLLYVLAMMLHFDGDRERAAAFFAAARDLETPRAAAAAADDADPKAIGVDT